MDPITQQVVLATAGAAGGGEALYVDDVFSIDLYRNDSTTEEFNNGLDMAGEGGLIVTKYRDLATDWAWVDSERGVTKVVKSNSTNQEATEAWIQSFDNDGFTHGSYIGTANNSGVASWSFRKAPGFFDVVTYTGDGVSGRAISHNLGSRPGVVIVKRTDSTGGNWFVNHYDNISTERYFFLDSDSQADTTTIVAGGYVSAVGTSSFGVYDFGTGMANVNAIGGTYVAYIFAHDDQSFGTNGNESIIKCGSYTGNGSTAGPVINLGFEPQFLIIRCATRSGGFGGGWYLFDSMRGIFTGANDPTVQAQESNAEAAGNANISLTPTGFQVDNPGVEVNASGGTYIYIAIRRPHKPPTAATEVFAVTEDTTATNLKSIDISFPTDFAIQAVTEAGQKYAYSRLTGNSYLRANSPDAESALSAPFSVEFDQQNTFTTYISDQDNVFYNFRRAPGFFDVVTYTGVSATVTVNHNLKVVPELIIVKSRDGQRAWPVMFNFRATLHDWISGLNSNAQAYFDRSYSSQYAASQPTSTSISFTAANDANVSGENFIAYLFASLDGISKVGSYSGTGNNIDVDCGFTAGARFVLIKRTDSTGDWYVWDTERGIVSGNDPYLLINSDVAEVTTTDYIDPLNAGFTVTSTAPDALNASGGTYFFLAIA